MLIGHRWTAFRRLSTGGRPTGRRTARAALGRPVFVSRSRRLWSVRPDRRGSVREAAQQARPSGETRPNLPVATFTVRSVGGATCAVKRKISALNARSSAVLAAFPRTAINLPAGGKLDQAGGSAPRMAFGVNLAQSLVAHMGVDGGGVQPAVGAGATKGATLFDIVPWVLSGLIYASLGIYTFVSIAKPARMTKRNAKANKPLHPTAGSAPV
jgi:hypothetical protein